MKMYVEFRTKHPNKEAQILANSAIPQKFNTYLKQLGAKKLKALNYVERLVKAEIEFIKSKDRKSVV